MNTFVKKNPVYYSDPLFRKHIIKDPTTETNEKFQTTVLSTDLVISLTSQLETISLFPLRKIIGLISIIIIEICKGPTPRLKALCSSHNLIIEMENVIRSLKNVNT